MRIRGKGRQRHQEKGRFRNRFGNSSTKCLAETKDELK